MLKHGLAVIAAVLLAIAPVSAADLGGPKPTIAKQAQPTRAAISPLNLPSPLISTNSKYDWSGVYIGVHGGNAWNEPDASANGSFVGELDMDSIALGGLLGYQRQIGQWVVGVEADITALPKDQTLTAGGGAMALSGGPLTSVRGKLGIAFDRFHLYGTLGWAWADWENTATVGGATAKDTISTDGLVYGAGLQFAITDRIALGTEYLKYDLGGMEMGSTVGGVTPAIDIDDIHVARATLTFKFGK